MYRKKTREIRVGNIKIGNNAPISIQSMITTDPIHVEKSILEINRLAVAGCELVRVAVPTKESALAIKQIKERAMIPIIADIHFDYTLALLALESGVDGLRINPGNIGPVENVIKVVEKARVNNIPIRIGINSGSLPKHIIERYHHPCADGMVEAALEHIRILENLKYQEIKVSIKSSEVPMMIEAYKKLSDKIDYPLHLGVTEAGTIKQGTVKSSIGIGSLLAQGIGDTIRVSLTGDPIHEVEVAKMILSSLELRNFGPVMISCPTCGRCRVSLFDIAEVVEERLKQYKQSLKVAVMGCVVNGPGEAREADFGIAGGDGKGVVFKKGKIVRTVPENELVEALFWEIDEYLKGESNNVS